MMIDGVVDLLLTSMMRLGDFLDAYGLIGYLYVGVSLALLMVLTFLPDITSAFFALRLAWRQRNRGGE